MENDNNAILLYFIIIYYNLHTTNVVYRVYDRIDETRKLIKIAACKKWCMKLIDYNVPIQGVPWG